MRLLKFFYHYWIPLLLGLIFFSLFLLNVIGITQSEELLTVPEIPNSKTDEFGFIE